MLLASHCGMTDPSFGASEKVPHASRVLGVQNPSSCSAGFGRARLTRWTSSPGPSKPIARRANWSLGMLRTLPARRNAVL